MKVMYIDGVGPFGGASRSLFEAVQVLSGDSVSPVFVAADGTAANFYRKVATDTVLTRGLSRFDNTQYSHYRGMRWLVLLREIFHFPYTVQALLKARRKWNDVDVIHVNEVTEIIPGLLAKRLFGKPLVVHVRSPQRQDTHTLRTRWVNRMLRKHADAVIAINENTRATLPADIQVEVIQNSFTAKRSASEDAVILGKLDSLDPSSLKVGFVGNLHHSKGLFDLAEAARLLKERNKNVEFLIVGGVAKSDKGIKAWLLAKAGLAQDVQQKLREKIEEYGIADSFHMLGATNDIQCVYERLDVISFPSHYDAPGRPVFEAAFSAVPSIVCVSRPYPDTLIEGETGLAIPARNPEALANAISHFSDDRSEVLRMGERAKRLAIENFVPATNAKKLFALYQKVASVR
ncbi:glycosyltransferase family 4 protein [Herbaspirillum robiniae]|uniref:glycosyltransferase family 4 protein n=1 Tax=Herbaspirillum robiniae TaxID=2014887 RepID=UPI003D7730ED